MILNEGKCGEENYNCAAVGGTRSDADLPQTPKEHSSRIINVESSWRGPCVPGPVPPRHVRGCLLPGHGRPDRGWCLQPTLAMPHFTAVSHGIFINYL